MTTAKQKHSLVVKQPHAMRIEELELRRIRSWMENGSGHLIEMDNAGIERTTIIHFYDKGFLDFDHRRGTVSMTPDGRKYLAEKKQKRIELAKKLGILLVEVVVPTLEIVAKLA